MNAAVSESGADSILIMWITDMGTKESKQTGRWQEKARFGRVVSPH
jgi:hypothetical protein